MAEGFFARDVVIVGGGCYGTFYAGQLERARQRGRARFRRVIVVDREADCRAARELGASSHRTFAVADWDDFFQSWLGGEAGPDDAIVPSPLMPHLMYRWLVARARARWPGREVETRPVPDGPGTPYDVSAPDGTRYVSYADWLCPVHCVEPAVCPVIRAPRSWEMSDAMDGLARRLHRHRPTAGPALFICRHRIYGVGMFDVSEVLSGDRLVTEAGESGAPVDVLVGTISSCHGAASLLHLGPVPRIFQPSRDDAVAAFGEDARGPEP